MANLDLTSVLRKENGEGADFKHSSFIPRQIELVDLPVINVGVIIPWLWLVVLPLVLHLWLLWNVAIVLMLHRPIHLFLFGQLYSIHNEIIYKTNSKFHPLILLTKPIKPLEEKNNNNIRKCFQINVSLHCPKKEDTLHLPYQLGFNSYCRKHRKLT